MPRRCGSRSKESGFRDTEAMGMLSNDFRIDVSSNQRIDASGTYSRVITTGTGTQSFKINDLSSASSVTSSMQIETDIGGVTANKILTPTINSLINSKNGTFYLVANNIPTGNVPVSNPWFIVNNSSYKSTISVDTTPYTMVRFVNLTYGTFASDTKYYLKYKNSYSATLTDYSDPCTSEVSGLFTAQYTWLSSNWGTLTGGALGGVRYFTMGITNGDGAKNGYVLQLFLEFK